MPVTKDDVRKLATIEEITEIKPIQDADAIMAAKIRGWTVVVKKDEFQVGDAVVYFEEDTALPLDDERFAFLAPRGSKEDEGKFYHVLKTARLRGTYSQGLALPLEQFEWDIRRAMAHDTTENAGGELTPGKDVTHLLGLGKWDTPLPVGNGQVAGPFLTKLARKTDSERAQNLGAAWGSIKATEWDITEKVDGTSLTVLRDEEGKLRVMGRNWEIIEGDNTYWNVVKRYSEIFDTLEPLDVIQAEICGPGILGNKLQLKDVRPFIFDFARSGEMLPRENWPEVVKKYAVPLVDMEFPDTIEELVDAVDGMRSLITPKVKAEGVVFHTKDGSILNEIGGRNTFKVISNAFLLKQK